VASDNDSGEDIVAADERELEKQTDSVKGRQKIKRDAPWTTRWKILFRPAIRSI